MNFFSLIVALGLVASTGCAPTPSVAEEQVTPQDATCSLYFANSNLCAELDWIVHPSDNREASFYLNFYDPADTDKKPLAPSADLAVELWMPSMGHGSAQVTILNEEPGRYKVTHAYFIMPGDWEVRIQLVDENKVVDQQAYALDI